VISSVQPVTDKLGNVTKTTGLNIAFGVFTQDLQQVKNFNQYFRIKVRNFAFVSQSGVGD